jgi:hypothetical protein
MSCGPLISELAGRTPRWDLTFAVLGPLAAGKTAAARAALGQAAANGVACVYLDLRQARDIWKVDDFYSWLLRSVSDALDEEPLAGNGRRRRVVAVPRVAWLGSMEKMLGRRKERVLLALDHIECIADACAHELISDLREIQDRSHADPAWSRFRCILAGAVSVFQLRRRANSPNLQFAIRRLPEWDAADAAAVVRQYVEGWDRHLDDAAIEAVARLTGGETAFLNILGFYLPSGDITVDVVERTKALIVKDATRFVELAAPVHLYALDAHFREHANEALESRPASWCNPAMDVEAYQLAGAFVVGDPLRREVRFRNDLIRTALTACRTAYAAAEAPSRTGEVPLLLLQQRCLAAATVGELLEAVGEAWQYMTQTSGQPELLVRDPVESRWFSVRRESIVVEQKGRSTTPVVELTLGRTKVDVRRHDGWWTIDTITTHHLVTGVRVTCAEGFVPTVSMREVLRLWALFLDPFDDMLHRLGLDALGRAALKGRLPHGGKRVFVSSTSADMKECRQAVLEQIVRRDLLFRGMEHFGASADQPSERIVEEVQESDVYLGIFGARYGSIDENSGLSMTELEFNEAEARGMPMLLYVTAPDAVVKRADIESDPQSVHKLGALLTRVKSRVVYHFHSHVDLGRQVYIDLQRFT